jgi:ankyrin repeat protein
MKDVKGQTPLWWAVKNKHKAIAQQLLRNDKVDPNAQERDGETSLY